MELQIWAEVSWTAEAKSKLTSKQYRYISPVALVRRSDRRLVGIHSVALTNKPAIVGMRPVVNRAGRQGGESGGQEAQVGSTEVGLAGLREALALEASTDAETVLVAATDRIRTLGAAEASRQASERVATAMAGGKLTAVQRDWAMALALRDPAEFDLWEVSAPRVVALGRTVPPAGDVVDSGLLRRTVESAARAEWRVNRAQLEKLCSEEAFVLDAVRQAGP